MKNEGNLTPKRRTSGRGRNGKLAIFQKASNERRGSRDHSAEKTRSALHVSPELSRGEDTPTKVISNQFSPPNIIKQTKYSPAKSGQTRGSNVGLTYTVTSLKQGEMSLVKQVSADSPASNRYNSQLRESHDLSTSQVGESFVRNSQNMKSKLPGLFKLPARDEQASKALDALQTDFSDGELTQIKPHRFTKRAGGSSSELITVKVSTRHQNNKRVNEKQTPKLYVATQSSSDSRKDENKLGKIEQESDENIVSQEFRSKRAFSNERPRLKPVELYKPPQALEAQCFSAFSICPQAKDTSFIQRKKQIGQRYGLTQDKKLGPRNQQKSFDKVESLLNFENQQPATTQNTKRDGFTHANPGDGSPLKFIGPGAVNVQNQQLSGNFEFLEQNKTFLEQESIQELIPQKIPSFNDGTENTKFSKTHISQKNYNGYTVPRQPNFNRDISSQDRQRRRIQNFKPKAVYNADLEFDEDVILDKIPLKIQLMSPMTEGQQNPGSPGLSQQTGQFHIDQARHLKIQDQGSGEEMFGQGTLKHQETRDGKFTMHSDSNTVTFTKVGHASRPKSSVLHPLYNRIATGHPSVKSTQIAPDSSGIKQNQQQAQQKMAIAGLAIVVGGACSETNKLDPAQQSKEGSSLSMSQQLKNFESHHELRRGLSGEQAKKKSPIKLQQGKKGFKGQPKEEARLQDGVRYNALKIVDQNQMVQIPAQAADEVSQPAAPRPKSRQVSAKQMQPIISTRKGAGVSLISGGGYSKLQKTVFSARHRDQKFVKQKTLSKIDTSNQDNTQRILTLTNLQIEGTSKGTAASNDGPQASPKNEEVQSPMILVPLSYLTDPRHEQTTDKQQISKATGVASARNNANVQNNNYKKSNRKNLQAERNQKVYLTNPLYMLNQDTLGPVGQAALQQQLYNDLQTNVTQQPSNGETPSMASTNQNVSQQKYRRRKNYSNFIQKYASRYRVQNDHLKNISEIEQRIFNQTEEPLSNLLSESNGQTQSPMSGSLRKGFDTKFSEVDERGGDAVPVHTSQLSRRRYMSQVRKNAFHKSSRNIRKFYQANAQSKEEQTDQNLLKGVLIKSYNQIQHLNLSNAELNVSMSFLAPSRSGPKEDDEWRPKTSQNQNHRQFLFLKMDQDDKGGSQMSDQNKETNSGGKKHQENGPEQDSDGQYVVSQSFPKNKRPCPNFLLQQQQNAKMKYKKQLQSQLASNTRDAQTSNANLIYQACQAQQTSLSHTQKSGALQRSTCLTNYPQKNDQLTSTNRSMLMRQPLQARRAFSKSKFLQSKGRSDTSNTDLKNRIQSRSSLGTKNISKKEKSIQDAATPQRPIGSFRSRPQTGQYVIYKGNQSLESKSSRSRSKSNPQSRKMSRVENRTYDLSRMNRNFPDLCANTQDQQEQFQSDQYIMPRPAATPKVESPVQDKIEAGLQREAPKGNLSPMPAADADQMLRPAVAQKVYPEPQTNPQNSSKSVASKSASNLINNYTETRHQSPISRPVNAIQEIDQGEEQMQSQEQRFARKGVFSNQTQPSLLEEHKGSRGGQKSALRLNEKHNMINEPSQPPASASSATLRSQSNYQSRTRLKPRQSDNLFLTSDQRMLPGDFDNSHDSKPLIDTQQKVSGNIETIKNQGTLEKSPLLRQGDQEGIHLGGNASHVSLTIRSIKSKSVSRKSGLAGMSRVTSGVVDDPRGIALPEEEYDGMRDQETGGGFIRTIQTPKYFVEPQNPDLYSLITNKRTAATHEDETAGFTRFKGIKAVPGITKTQYTKFTDEQRNTNYDKMIEENQKRFLKRKSKIRNYGQLSQQQSMNREQDQPIPNRFRCMRMYNTSTTYNKTYDKVVKSVHEYKQNNVALRGDGCFNKAGQASQAGANPNYKSILDLKVKKVNSNLHYL